KQCDEPIILIKGNIKALRKGIFEVTEALMDIRELNSEIPGYEQSLESSVIWTTREMRLHGNVLEELVFSLKIDGRPFYGKSQVSVGIVPLKVNYQSTQSAKSVITLAIANCEEKRPDIKMLFSNLNEQKEVLKQNGIMVDGKMYKVSFKVTLDYKGLVLIFVKKEDENFMLGGKGLNVEFCLFCKAKRACDCKLGNHEVCLEHFLETKANVGGFKGLRDDLTCILGEDLSSVSLCALHCEMRNTEQMLKNIGLLAHEIGSLDECNKKLSEYGPQNIKSDRISVKVKPGQQSSIERHNISVCSFSGNTERKILDDLRDIIEESLPQEKLTAHFQDQESAIACITNKISFCEARVKYYEEMLDSGVFIRDFGTRLEEMELANTEASQEMNRLQQFWDEKRTEIEDQFTKVYEPVIPQKGRKKQSKPMMNPNLSAYAALLTKEFVIMCKEWGFLLLEMFGRSLGTGDYGHLTVDHASMLLRMHRSFRELSNQGFEASHKLQRQVYAKCTSHDASDYVSSVKQMFLHMNAEKLLELRYAFREAKNSISSGKPFLYRGCGWKKKHGSWSDEEKEWILKMDNLFTDQFGPEFCKYTTTEKKTCTCGEAISCVQ
ncbi:hypothetical protein QZH41_018347, partial [Actinostola sp. cb2023]